MIYLRVKNLRGDIIMDSFPEDFLASEGDKKSEGYRYSHKETKFGTLEVLIVNEGRISNSNRVHKLYITSLESALEVIVGNISNKARDIADDYLHNIIKIHGNQKSIIERCLQGAEGRDSYVDFVCAVGEKIKGDPDNFAEEICALSKEIRLTDYHIGGYNLMRDVYSRINITHNHNLKTFLLGLAHLFFESLNKNHVILSLHDIDQNFRCSFEYETFNIAMHCFLENTNKYSKPYTKVVAYTNNEVGELVFEMESVRIDKDEIDKIFKRGIFGHHVPHSLRGNGIGMYLLKTALNRSGISIFINPDLSKATELNGVKYTKNIFAFRFPNYSIRS